MPYLEREGKPGLFHSPLPLETLETALMEAGFQGGSCSRACPKYEP